MRQDNQGLQLWSRLALGGMTPCGGQSGGSLIKMASDAIKTQRLQKTPTCVYAANGTDRHFKISKQVIVVLSALMLLHQVESL